MTAPVDAVLFDLDDTLCSYRRSSAELLAVAFDAAGVEPFFDAADYHETYDDLLGTDEMDAMADFRTACFVSLAEEAGRDPAVAREVAAAYAAERDQSAVEPASGLRATLDALAADHRLGLVTNGPRDMQREKLSAVGLDDHFETAVFAGDGAPAKPDPEPFHRALDDLGVSPERAVHVGNSLRTDVAGARAAGLRAAWIPDGDGAVGEDFPPDPEPDYHLDGFDALAAPPWR